MALPKETVDEIRNYIEVQGIAWAREFIAGRAQYLRNSGISTSGQLLNSLAFEVESQLDEALKTKISLAFPDYGRFRDMKRLNAPAGGGTYIENLEAWMRQKGLVDKMTRGFMARRKLKRVPVTVVNQIAWGIAIKRSIAYRRKSGWYAKSKSASITDLYNSIAANLPDLILKEIKSSFNS